MFFIFQLDSLARLYGDLKNLDNQILCTKMTHIHQMSNRYECIPYICQTERNEKPKHL